MNISDFALFTISEPTVFYTVFVVLAVAFVNGWTDAPNAIASSVSTRSIRMKNAIIIAAISDFFGAVLIGILNNNVTRTMVNISDFGDDRKTALLSISAAMTSVVLWAVFAWFFGIPTSESHALIAGLSGASVAVNNGFQGIDYSEWKKVIYGLFLSVLLGFILGYTVSKLTVKLFYNIDKSKSDKIFSVSQIISSVFMSFMHGAQDAQKFVGVLVLISEASLSENHKKIPLGMLIMCSFIIASGTATGGERIIKSVGMDMIKLRKDQGFSADLSGALCLFISTLCGFPVSTTHTKTSAVLGVGVAKSTKSVNWKVAGEMVIAWILTFPGCGLLSWAICCLFLKFF